MERAHVANTAHFREGYDKAAKRMLRVRDDLALAHLSDSLVERANIARKYAQVFGLVAPVFDTSGDADRIWTVRNSPKRVAARAKRLAASAELAARYAEAERLRRIEQAKRDIDLIAAWRATGARSPYGRRLNCPEGGAMIRAEGDTVQTSWGIRDMPLGFATAALGFYCGKRYDLLVGAKLGGFKITSADAEKVNIGCHVFYRLELERFADLIGLIHS
jgi:hypothetical protein